MVISEVLVYSRSILLQLIIITFGAQTILYLLAEMQSAGGEIIWNHQHALMQGESSETKKVIFIKSMSFLFMYGFKREQETNIWCQNQHHHQHKWTWN